MATKRTGSFGTYYGSAYSESEPLTQTEMNANARYIYLCLTAQGWTTNAIAALLGNMTAESSLNPGRWQSDIVGASYIGYGLVQWTPATKYFDWCNSQGFSDPSEMDNNLARILYEVANGLQWISTDNYNYSFLAFTKSATAAGTLAKAFLLNYERPADQSVSVQEYRAGLANSWYEFLTGTAPPDPPTPPTPWKGRQRKYKFLLFNRRSRTWTRNNS